MTEITTCPTCGGKCTKEGGSEFGYIITKPLPQPDLTKLREVYYRYVDLAGPYMRNDAYPFIMQALKEVLDDQDNQDK